MLSAVIPELPNPHDPHIRQIVEQERLAEILAGLGVSAMKLDDVIGGFAFIVGRRPEVFPKESQTGWSRAIVKWFPTDVPHMRIWFTYDEDNVYIEHVELLEE
jgi:hypothetical protein